MKAKAPETRKGLHWVDVPCKREHTTWAHPGITADLEHVGCKRCIHYLSNPDNFTDGKARLPLDDSGEVWCGTK